MFSAAEMRELQADAESLMTLTFMAYGPGGTVTDSDGATSEEPAEKGPTIGKVQGGSQAAGNPITRTISVGGVEVPVVDGGLHIPLTSYVDDTGLLLKAGPRGTGWEFVCTAAGAADDPSLVGRRYLVVSVPAKSRATARRLDVVELTPPPA